MNYAEQVIQQGREEGERKGRLEVALARSRNCYGPGSIGRSSSRPPEATGTRCVP